MACYNSYMSNKKRITLRMYAGLAMEVDVARGQVPLNLFLNDLIRIGLRQFQADGAMRGAGERYKSAARGEYECVYSGGFEDDVDYSE